METLNLDALVPQDIKIEFKKEEFIIPKEPPMDFVLQYYGLNQKVEKLAKSKKADEQINALTELCKIILNQDKSKNVTSDFINKNLSFGQMQRLVEFYTSQIGQVETDPN